MKVNDCYRFRANSLDKDQRYEDFSNLCNKENDFHFMMKIRPEDDVFELKNEPEAIESSKIDENIMENP